MISILIIIAYSIEPKLDLQEIPEQGHGCGLPKPELQIHHLPLISF